MSDMITRQGLSYDTLRSNLKSYVQSIDNYEVRWKDFYEGGPGQTITELVAGMGSYLNYTALMSRREVYLDEAQLRTSLIGICTTLGYDINRASSAIYRINITIPYTTSWDKFTPIGTYNANSISLVDSASFTPNEYNLNVLLGDWKTVSFTGSDGNDYARFLVEDVIDNERYELQVNGVDVSVVRNAEELDDTNVLERTYNNGMYLIFGDGIFGKKLYIGDTVTFTYFSPAPQSDDNTFDLSLVGNRLGTVNSGGIVTYGTMEDSNDKLRVVGPGYFTTKRRLITLNDYKYIGLSRQGVISVNCVKHPGICCTVDMAVLPDSRRSMLPYEKTALLQYLDQFKVVGTTINLVDIFAIRVNISILVVTKPNADFAMIQSSIRSYFDLQTYKLGGLFAITGILAQELEGAIRIYPKYPVIDKQAEYNQYFVIDNFNITFSTNVNTVEVIGTDTSIGYVIDGTV